MSPLPLFAATSLAFAAFTAFAAPSSYPLIEKRVVNGHAASEGEYPYTVRVTLSANNMVSSCGGTIIGEQAVVTAAHCLFNKTENAAVNHSQVKVGFGNNNATLQTYVPAQDVVVHPDYNSMFNYHDIALVKVSGIPFQKNTVESLKVYRGLLPEGTSLTSLGWGVMTPEFGSHNVSDVLKKTTVKIANINDCKDYIVFKESSDGPQICTENKFTPGTSACYGDSGTGLIATVNGTSYLAGLVSYGYGPEFEQDRSCTREDGFVIYTHIVSYLDFLSSATGTAESSF
ncbi:trypsin-like serine protease [Martensiomyces pterosporus]|nr:trypsin-like serine protease [Martensiomyces pterosporus]